MKKTLISLSVILLFFVGCSTTSTVITNEIPNFRIVDSKNFIYRGGQPTTNGFIYLKSIGITNIVKLNTASEGSDEYVKNLGIRLVYVPLDKYNQLIYTPMWKVTMAVTNIIPRTYVHCQHGQDRTGLIIADYEITIKGKSKIDAEKEMLDYGFHKSLCGLWERFENIK